MDNDKSFIENNIPEQLSKFSSEHLEKELLRRKDVIKSVERSAEYWKNKTHKNIKTSDISIQIGFDDYWNKYEYSFSLKIGNKLLDLYYTVFSEEDYLQDPDKFTEDYFSYVPKMKDKFGHLVFQEDVLEMIPDIFFEKCENLYGLISPNSFLINTYQELMDWLDKAGYKTNFVKY